MPMGAVEHLKTLCCLGLPPESAMIAVTPVLHEIIPHGWSRMGLYDSDATMRSAYSENRATMLCVDRFWEFLHDPSNIIGSLYAPLFEATGIGWALHRQGRGWQDSDWYREIEAPFDSCWWLDAMIGNAGRTTAAIHLTRPRSARPFTADDVQCFDRLRPWLAHAFRRSNSRISGQEGKGPISTIGASVACYQMILTPDAKIIFETPSLERRLRMILGEPWYNTTNMPTRNTLPAPIFKLLQQLTGAANGTCNVPPRMQLSTPYGALTLEAKWLVPTGAVAQDVARDPKSCLISVTIELHEHPIAHAARMLRESGATPTQTKVGIQLALGKTKPLIADELGIRLSSVADLTKRLYQTLDVHNSAELGTKIWLGRRQDGARQNLRRAG